jgi:CelD/BcsL family acetyltransferase involved in cellulose biosynthesis/RimJ/RimL family protein N-acetyltransferase
MSATPAILMRGAQAHAAMQNEEFVTHWLALLEGCPYATPFQRPEFVRPWYSTYRGSWEPIVLLARDVAGDLTGLWLLAWSDERRALVHAGAQQAEYHTWLARAGAEASFLKSAWIELRRNLSFACLSFEYLPSADLANLLKTTLGAVSVRRRRRPLLRLDPESIRASLAKKKTRYRFNRLARLGTLEFRRIVDPDEFERAYDELIDFYDFRQGAMYRVTPFRTDSLKREFHRALFTSAPQRVLLTVSYLAGRPIAGCWCVTGSGQAHVGLVIYSPFLAEHSPGILHFMQLSEYLSQNGVALIDLTAGGDAWKERFANEHDEVASAILYASRWQWLRAECRTRVAPGARWLLRLSRLTPKQARRALARLRHATPLGLLRGIGRWVWESRQLRIYAGDRALALRHVEDARVRRNSLADLMLFQPAESSPPQEDFLSTALARLEEGESVWTIKLDESLAHHGWTAVKGELRLTEVEQTLVVPPGSLLLHGCYSAPALRRRGLHRAAVGHMLRTAFADESLQHAYIAVPAECSPSRHVVETMGFNYRGSFYWRRRFGRVTKWADPVLCGPEHA